MNGRYRHLLGSQGIEILSGQRWIRQHTAPKINNPLNIEIIAEPDSEEQRFYIKDIGKQEYLFFFRDDIISYYDRKIFNGEMDLNEQICEILGWRHTKDENGEWVFASPGGKRGVRDYVGTPVMIDKLLVSLAKYKPKTKVGLGKYILYLDKPYRGSTREEAICKAWIDKNS